MDAGGPWPRAGEKKGHTRIYQWDGTNWSQLGSDIDGEAAEDRSGETGVSLSGDGTIVAIGAHQNDANGLNSGHTRIYQWNGSAWTQVGGDIDGEAAGDESGNTVSLSRDGSTVAIGAAHNAGNGAIRSRKSLCYRHRGDSTAPTFASAATNADGTKVVLTYNEALSATTAATTDFAVTTDGAANAVTAVASPAPIELHSPTPSKTIRRSPLPTPIHPAPTTTTPFKIQLEMTLHH